jgi:hypothetical protein
MRFTLRTLLLWIFVVAWTIAAWQWSRHYYQIGYSQGFDAGQEAAVDAFTKDYPHSVRGYSSVPVSRNGSLVGFWHIQLDVKDDEERSIVYDRESSGSHYLITKQQEETSLDSPGSGQVQSKKYLSMVPDYWHPWHVKWRIKTLTEWERRLEKQDTALSK